MTTSYIKWTQEQTFSFEIENFAKGLEKIGFCRLSLLCETIDLDEIEVRKHIRKASGNGENSCIIDGWKFSWLSIDDFRGFLKSKNIPLAPRMGRIHGKLKKEKKDFENGDYELNKLVDKFTIK